MLVDTDILIWYMRGNSKAYTSIEKLQNFSISVITYMELVQGMRNKKELSILRKTLKQWNVKVLYINEEISTQAMFLIENHYFDNSLKLADVFISTTAVFHGLKLFTANAKQYKSIHGLEIEIFKP